MTCQSATRLQNCPRDNKPRSRHSVSHIAHEVSAGYVFWHITLVYESTCVGAAAAANCSSSWCSADRGTPGARTFAGNFDLLRFLRSEGMLAEPSVGLTFSKCNSYFNTSVFSYTVHVTGQLPAATWLGFEGKNIGYCRDWCICTAGGNEQRCCRHAEIRVQVIMRLWKRLPVQGECHQRLLLMLWMTRVGRSAPALQHSVQLRLWML